MSFFACFDKKPSEEEKPLLPAQYYNGFGFVFNERGALVHRLPFKEFYNHTKKLPYINQRVCLALHENLNIIDQERITPNPARKFITQSRIEIENSIRFDNNTLSSKEPAQISVVNKDCLRTAQELSIKYKTKPVLLNMANSKHPGGHAFGGSLAQEEYLYGCTDLSKSLELYSIKHDGRYDTRAKRPLYGKNAFDPTDVLISTNITVLRFYNTGYRNEIKQKDIEIVNLEKNERFKINIISSAAPKYVGKNCFGQKKYKVNYKGKTIKINKKRTTEIKKAAIDNQLAAAKTQGNVLILSAWGCGAFKNDPVEMAALYKEVLEQPKYKNHFKEVVFAIKGGRLENYQEFAKCFNPQLTIGLQIKYSLN
jgi:hypothetical protein